MGVGLQGSSTATRGQASENAKQGRHRKRQRRKKTKCERSKRPVARGGERGRGKLAPPRKQRPHSRCDKG